MNKRTIIRIFLITAGFLITSVIAVSLVQIVNSNNALLMLEQQRQQEKERVQAEKKEALSNDTHACLLSLGALSSSKFDIAATDRELLEYLQNQVRSLSKAQALSAKGDYKDNKLESLISEAIDALSKQSFYVLQWTMERESGYYFEPTDSQEVIDRANGAEEALESYCNANY